MSKEDPLERSVRLLDEALNSPQRFIKLGSPKPRFSSLTTPSIQRFEGQNESLLFEGSRNEQFKKLRRSELLDLSITLEPGELTQLCDATNATTNILNEMSLVKVDLRLDNLLQQFQSSIQALGNTHNVFEAVSSFIEICTNSIDGLIKTKNITEDISWLINERNTWRLINALYKDRTIKYDEFLEDMMVEYNHERSEKELQEYFYKSNRSVREAQIVVDWLERIARDEWKLLERTEIGHYTDRTVAWENTLHSLQAGPGAVYRPSREIVTSLDPDAPRRQAMPLHDIDHEDDKRLLQQVFLEIRCGRLDKAQEHCVHCGQYWRADVLEGWRLFHDPNYLPPFSDTKLPSEGNPHRDVWKLCAWRMCSDPHVPQQERAVMGALCGHLPSLLAEADNWEDLLWAEMRVFVDVKVEQEIRDNSLRNYVDMPKEYWNGVKSLESIFTNVKTQEKGRIEGNRPDRIIQELIVLDNVPELLNRCSGWTEGQCQIQFLRFLAHLVLTLRMLGKSEPVHLGDNVLAAYVEALIAERNTDAIAYYASLLPEDKQIELFSTYMEMVGETEEKPNILAAAEKYDLNIKAITEKVVQTIRNRKLEEPDESTLVKETTDDDLKKISALDWMVYYKQQRVEAIWECNALIRGFIAEGKLPAARLAHNKIPDDSISLIVSQYNIQVDEDLNVHWEKFPPKVNSTLKEFLCYKAYLDAQDGFNHWFHQFHNTQPVKPVYPEGGDFTEIVTYEHKLEKYNEEYDRWKANMDHLTKNVKAQLNNIIVFPDKGWLVDDYEEDPVRKSHLEKLRSHCLPQIFMLLHKVLQSMELYDEAMGLCVLLMSEQYKFYEVFTKQGLEDMLKKITDTSFSLLLKYRNPFSSEPWPDKIHRERPHSPGWIFKNFPRPHVTEEGELKEVLPKEEGSGDDDFFSGGNEIEDIGDNEEDDDEEGDGDDDEFADIEEATSLSQRELS